MLINVQNLKLPLLTYKYYFTQHDTLLSVVWPKTFPTAMNDMNNSSASLDVQVVNVSELRISRFYLANVVV